MLIVALLITIILLSIFAKPRNVTNFRMAIGAIYGILFLVVWPYLRFVAEISEVEEQTIMMFVGLLFGLAVVVTFLPVISKIGPFGAASLFSVFVVLIAGSMAFEGQLKNGVAKFSGYFGDENPVKINQYRNTSNQFTSATGAYVINLPPAWQEKRLKDAGFPYFVLSKNSVKQAELRPKCFHGLDVALPEIVQRLKTSALVNGNSELQKKCFTWRDTYDACLVQRAGDNDEQFKSRWQWFAVNYDKPQGIELDFVLYEISENVTSDIEKIISSLEPIPMSTPPPVCLGTIEWF